MNHRNYPLLTKLFESLNVPLKDSDMSFGYHDLPTGLQYCGSGLSGLFAQRKNLIRPRFHRLIKEVFRFFSTASMDASKGLHPDETLGAYLKRNNFSQDFIDHHLIPMGSAIWSTPCEEMMAFPAQSFMNFSKITDSSASKIDPNGEPCKGAVAPTLNSCSKNGKMLP